MYLDTHTLFVFDSIEVAALRFESSNFVQYLWGFQKKVRGSMYLQKSTVVMYVQQYSSVYREVASALITLLLVYENYEPPYTFICIYLLSSPPILIPHVHARTRMSCVDRKSTR